MHFTLRKTKPYGKGEHAVKPPQLLSKSSYSASLRCRDSEGIHSLPLLAIKKLGICLALVLLFLSQGRVTFALLCNL
jgi:hypothetical protein